jgi:hypothetical protein
MCNLYSETKGQVAIRGLFRTAHDRTGNLPAFPGIFPDQMAPIVRSSGNEQSASSSWRPKERAGRGEHECCGFLPQRPPPSLRRSICRPRLRPLSPH